MKKLIKNIFSDIFLLYKNFFHFNISKILIFLVGFIYAFLVSIPFLVIGFGIYYYFYSLGEVQVFGSNIISLVFFYLNYFFGILIATAGFFYYFILMVKLNFSYIKGDKMSFKLKNYFNNKLFFKHLKLFILSNLFVFSPIIIFGFIIIFLIFILGGSNEVNNMMIENTFNIFSVISLILLIISFFLFVYFFYKTLFSAIILFDEFKEKSGEKITYFIKKSFKLTKGTKKFFNFIISFILVLLFSLPIIFPRNYFNEKSKEIGNFLYYFTHKDEIERFPPEYLIYLQNKYSNERIDLLEEEFKRDFYLYIFFQILNLLFVYGLFEMFLVSFYKRELKK